MKRFLARAGVDEGRWWLWNVVVLLGLALLVVLALMHVLQPAWRSVYFYNGDSLTLALLMKSLWAGEPFRWVFSSQLFLFPEGVVYALCSAVTGSIQASLLTNSSVAVVLLYAAYWLLARSILGTREGGHAFAMFATGLLVLYMSCETTPDINGLTFVTLYLFNTYYYGVVLCGLLVLYWIVQILLYDNRPIFLMREVAGPLVGILVVTGLTYFSDPLFFLQCSAPFLIALCILYFSRNVSGRTFIWLVVVQLLGLMLGSVGRGLCKAYVGNPVVKYFDFWNIVRAIKFLSGVFEEIVHTATSLFEYGLMAVGLAVAVAAIVLTWRQRRYQRFLTTNNLSAADMMVALIAFGSPVASISGALLTGNPWTRYWLPLAVFPVLAVLPLWRRFLHLSHKKTLVAVLICIAAVAGRYGSSLYAQFMAEGSLKVMQADVKCYNRVMSQKPFDTVGGYWTTRALDLYSDTTSRALQMTGDLHARIWLSNRAPYLSLMFNGIIVDKKLPEGEKPDHIYDSELRGLGPYSRKFSCPSFDIYYYDTGSVGYIKLNRLLRR